MFQCGISNNEPKFKCQSSRYRACTLCYVNKYQTNFCFVLFFVKILKRKYNDIVFTTTSQEKKICLIKQFFQYYF